MTEKPTTPPKKEPPRRRAVWRIARGRSGGSLALAIFVHWAIQAGRDVLAADGDPNNPLPAKLFPSEGKHRAQRPANAELVRSKPLPANPHAQALQHKASLSIDNNGRATRGETV